MNCSGTGSPAIIYMHGWAPFPGGAGYGPRLTISSEVGDGYRLCAYDRRNLGYSDTVDGPQSPDDAMRDLHRLLAAAGVDPPYVLLGASFGGLLAYLYANR